MHAILRRQCAQWKRDAVRKQRRNMTKHEAILWQHLKDKQLGVRVLPQAIIHGFVADFYVPKWRLLIEVDGPTHREAKWVAWDKIRDKAMKEIGLTTIRFSNYAVENSRFSVVNRIRAQEPFL
jgi:very-short-patch-repair endonuclease